MAALKQPHTSALSSSTVPELDQSQAALLSALASAHSRRAYKHAIDRFISWYCSEPRLGFSRSVVVRYRSFLESLSLSAATINLHLSAIRRLADEAADSGWLSPELAIGVRRVKGVKRLGRRLGNWLSRGPSAGSTERDPSKHFGRKERCGSNRAASWVRTSTLRSGVSAPGSTSVEGGALGHCRFVGQGRTGPHGTCSVLV